jgi:Raf kinase inhibitor-like YbhB/YbcL family protein
MPTSSMRPGRRMRRIETGSFAAALLCIIGSVVAPDGTAFAARQPRFRLASADLPPGKLIGEQFVANEFGCRGGNESPALQWSGAPAGTKSFAVTMFDPYKPPQSGWWHWIVYDLPAATVGLPRAAGAAGGAGLPSGTKQGTPDGDAPQPHYYGPCPDPGDPPHHYVITVYALSVDHLDVPPTATAADLDYVIAGKMIGKAFITRPYQRPAAGGK